MRTLRKRRKEGRTDYAKRFRLLKSEKPRLVLRRTNKYFVAQYTIHNETKDRVEFGVNSFALLKYGWPKEFEGSLKSVPAAYLLGFLAGKKIIKNKMERPIIDLGMTRNVHKSRSHAFLKGVIDSGIELKHDEKTFPPQDRLEGKHLKKDFSKFFSEIKSKIEKE